MSYIPSIGLEVHVQLRTRSKIFCSCANEFGHEQNTRVCPVCLGMPGTLPVLNKRAVELAVKTALSLGCTVFPNSIFARKNYFYPDLPKGYQISQFEEPLALNGTLEIPVNGAWKQIGITRIHLEEDAGKSLHPEGKRSVTETRIDINRCGVPLIEIVSEPDISSPAEAYQYLTRLKQTLQYLGVSDCNMEEGSLRCDANVSIRPGTAAPLGVKTELKNLNSFKYVEKALAYEINRQVLLLESGDSVRQETLTWNESRGTATPMRTKEGSDDYRYFPEPDLIPLILDEAWLEDIKAGIPELPRAKKERFIARYGLSERHAEVLTGARELADYFEAAADACSDPRKLGNWILSEVLQVLNEEKTSISGFSVPPADTAELVNLVEKGTISGKIAKEVFSDMVKTGAPPGEIIKKKGLEQITDTGSIRSAVEAVLNEHASEVRDYLDGKEKLMGFFIGQVMKATRGKANPGSVNKILREKLAEMASHV